VFRLLRRNLLKRTSDHKAEAKAAHDYAHIKLETKLDDNLNRIRNILGESNDVIIRDMKIGPNSNIHAAVVYIDGLVERNLVNHDILQPLMFNLPLIKDNVSQKHTSLLEFFKSTVLTVGQIAEAGDIGSIISAVLSGNIAILAEDTTKALLIDAKGWEKRSIEEPGNEVSIRGPKESFTETMRTNTALLRRKIKDPGLTFQNLQIGERTKTYVTVAYIKGITPENLIKEINQRLNRIDTDSILDVGYIEQYIEDAPKSLFPTVGTSERPDVTAAKLLEGRVAILVDGSPMALTMPYLFIEGFQSPEDYYTRPFYATIIRWVRLLGFLLSIYLPGLFVSLSAFHPELFPTELLVSVAAAREGIPFPVVLEALLMVLTFEILREAGLRLPRPLGQAVSIVGALVIGQSAVSAGLVGAPMVIVVATTAIASFLVVPYADTGALLRFLLLIVSGILGLFGMVLFSLEILSHLASLRSLGASYLSPLVPVDIKSFKDTFIRAPLWAMEDRPEFLHPLEKKRQAPDLMPQATKSSQTRRDNQ